VAAKLRAGMVFWNCYHVVDVSAPFGGMKQSGFGREGECSCTGSPLSDIDVMMVVCCCGCRHRLQVENGACSPISKQRVSS